MNSTHPRGRQVTMDNDGWLTGPALEVLEKLNGVHPGDFVQIRWHGELLECKVAATDVSEGYAPDNSGDHPYALEVLEGIKRGETKWRYSRYGIVAWRRGERG